MNRCTAWLFLWLTTCGAAAFGVQGSLPQDSNMPRLRPDIKTKWQERLCAKQQPPTMRELWQAGIYDAQLQGHFMTVKSGLQATPSQLAQAAIVLAKRTSHNGYNYGTCSQTSVGWVVTSPAASDDIKIASDNSISLSWSAIRPYCYEAHIDYVAAASGRARNLSILTKADHGSEIRIDASLLNDGTISVTCYPLYGKNLGPELWFLAPVKRGPLAQPPGTQATAKSENSYAPSLLHWINKVRADARVPALKKMSVGQKRHMDISLLAQNDSIHHDTSHLKSVQTMIHKTGGIFVGENRVQGEGLKEMEWLLWNSPRHRDLLLNPKADSLAVSQINDKTQRLVVLTFAKYEVEGLNTAE